MLDQELDTKTLRVRPIVKKGAALGYARELKEKGLWPPRLHNRKDHNDNDRKPTATPFLIIPCSATDNGTRPQPNSQAFHSQSIWIEDSLGNVITTPVVGNTYTIKCRIINIGAFASYGGLVEFYIDKPGVFNSLAGTTASLPAFGRSGFSLLPGRHVDVKCPNAWNPLTDNELLVGILVQAYDPFADMFTSKFDARNDRHIARHDFTSDFFVRDWTSSTSIHDFGSEPSSDPQFYVRSDVWNRRSNNPGIFTNDQPSNQNPQSGAGATGDNFMFARISRNDASTTENVKAHFMFAEFGTGSPYVDCSASADPSVTFLPGETSKIISLPWHLHPSSSNHLCIAVQVYSDADPFMPPGLLGYTPGWPTTDMMVINDNNKAQRNIEVWDGLPEEEGMHFAMIYNSATYIRDFELSVKASPETAKRFVNAKAMIHGSDQITRLQESSSLKVSQMLPGERRWVVFSYDSFSAGEGESLQIMFDEFSGNNVLNGFCLDIRATNKKDFVVSSLHLQQAAFSRMEAMEIKHAAKGLALCRKLLEGKPNEKNYISVLPELSHLLMICIEELSVTYNGLKDTFGVTESIQQLGAFRGENNVSKAIAHHHKLLNQLDAWQTTAMKSRGDEASILFTVRLQKDLYSKEPLITNGNVGQLIKETRNFIKDYSTGKVNNKDYVSFVEHMLDYFKTTSEIMHSRILTIRLDDLVTSLRGETAGIQKAHIGFLNDLLLITASKKVRY